MSKITKKQLQRKIERQETRIDRLVGMLAKKGFYDKFKKLDQSIFNDEPPHLRWAAIEEDGSVYLFAKKPFIDLCKWAAGTDEVEVYIGTEYDASNWQNSLIERKAELTGSDLCRAMLARGDKFVLCKGSEISDIDAIKTDWACVATHATDDGGFDASDFLFEFLVPINNQGEPLTAKEVGL